MKNGKEIKIFIGNEQVACFAPIEREIDFDKDHIPENGEMSFDITIDPITAHDVLIADYLFLQDNFLN